MFQEENCMGNSRRENPNFLKELEDQILKEKKGFIKGSIIRRVGEEDQNKKGSTMNIQPSF
jgi:hypothetical protein